MAKPARYRVTPAELAATPVSRLLYGHFIELGYGLQTELMSAEMLFNRSFEKLTPYRDINKEWFDLWLDASDPSKGYETDWSRYDWYHSGYEHNAWFAAPGEQPSLLIRDDSTFFVEQSSTRDVSIARQSGALHGESCLRLDNREAQEWGGVAQSGKFLRCGEALRFRGQMKAAP